jgi:hypothetical protein
MIILCDLCHAWTDRSFREAAGLGWIVTPDDKGEGPSITQGTHNIGGQQTAFDAELMAIEQVVDWFQGAEQQHMTVHSDCWFGLGLVAGGHGPHFVL